MLRFFRNIGTISLVLVLNSWSSFTAEASDKPLNGPIRQVLVIRQQLSEKGTRGDVLRYFRPDGGVQIEQNQVFVYQLCDYIKIKVRFKSTNLGKLDPIASISNLYIEDPVLD